MKTDKLDFTMINKIEYLTEENFLDLYAYCLDYILMGIVLFATSLFYLDKIYYA